MVAWAMDPVMSSLYIRESNLMLELKSLVFGSISFENRPVQSFIGGKTSYSLSSSLYAWALIACALIGRPNRLMKPAESVWS